MIERLSPPFVAGEKEMLCAFLDYQRATLLLKVDGLSDEDLRRVIVPSGWSLLGLVKHLAQVEAWWFQTCFMGREVVFPWDEDDPNADFRIEPEETTEQILSLYEEQVGISQGIVADAALEDMVRGPHRPGRSLRWVLMHMIEEVARHNGHADVVRELIDGSVGV